MACSWRKMIDSYATTAEDVSSVAADGSDANEKKGQKKTGTNRVWDDNEEEALMEVLKMAYVSGLKAENGWKSNYKNYLWTNLNKLLPGTDLKVQPHIMSKLKQWGHEYSCVSAIKDKSGAGWDAVEKRVICSPEMWRSHIKGHHGMTMKKRNEKWKFYEDWEVLFGKDRANGKGAISLNDAAKRFIPDIINNANKKKLGGSAHDYVDEAWLDEEDVATSGHCNKKAKSTPTFAAPGNDDGFLTAMKEIFSQETVVNDSTNALRAKINDALIPMGMFDNRMMMGRKMAVTTSSALMTLIE